MYGTTAIPNPWATKPGNHLVLLCFTGYLRMLSNLSEQSIYHFPQAGIL